MKSNILSMGVQSIEISGIRKFSSKVAEVEGALSLTLGQPDFPVPAKIKEAMIKALKENKTEYTANAGIVELREGISKYLKTFGIDYSADEICITAGGTEGIIAIFASLVNPGDKVLIPDPAFPAYESCARLLLAKPIKYNLIGENFDIDFQQLENIIKTEKPKFMVISYPSNPTGAILSEEANEKLHKIVKENNIIVVSDEIYSALCYEDKYHSISQYSDIKDNVVIVSGFSKIFSMTGLRVGYVCASGKIIESVLKTHQYTVTCAPSIAQYGAVEGLRNSLPDAEYMKKEFIKRRDYVYKELKDMGFEVGLPKGAFYIFPSIKKYNLSSTEFCEKLLKEAKVAIVPGDAFGNCGEGFARISYASSMEVLSEAMDRIRKWTLKNN